MSKKTLQNCIMKGNITKRKFIDCSDKPTFEGFNPYKGLAYQIEGIDTKDDKIKLSVNYHDPSRRGPIKNIVIDIFLADHLEDTQVNKKYSLFKRS